MARAAPSFLHTCADMNALCYTNKVISVPLDRFKHQASHLCSAYKNLVKGNIFYFLQVVRGLKSSSVIQVGKFS